MNTPMPSMTRLLVRTLSASFVLAVMLAGCATDGPDTDREISPGPTSMLDPTDYDANRVAIEQFYHRDFLNYWERHGLPATARLDLLLDNSRNGTTSAFAALKAVFDRGAFVSALEAGELPALFTTLYRQRIDAGMEPWPAATRAIRELVIAADLEREIDMPDDRDMAPTEILASVFSVAFPQAAELYAPSAAGKQPKVPLEPPQDPVCQPGSNAFEPMVTSRPPGTDDNDTSSTRDWTDISGILWDTTYNASCVAQAVGPCAAKLGIRGDGISGDTMTCSDWNDLSRAVGAVERGPGGTRMSKVNEWFRGKGYCASIAYDGLFESACDEARKAHARGCNVLMHYSDPNGGSAHVEMVRSLSTNADDSEKCTVATFSWGQRETVGYDRGSYSGKTDGRRYRNQNEAKSYLEGTGNAKLYYYCPC